MGAKTRCGDIKPCQLGTVTEVNVKFDNISPLNTSMIIGGY